VGDSGNKEWPLMKEWHFWPQRESYESFSAWQSVPSVLIRKTFRDEWAFVIKSSHQHCSRANKSEDVCAQFKAASSQNNIT